MYHSSVHFYVHKFQDLSEIASWKRNCIKTRMHMKKEFYPIVYQKGDKIAFICRWMNDTFNRESNKNEWWRSIYCFCPSKRFTQICMKTFIKIYQLTWKWLQQAFSIRKCFRNNFVTTFLEIIGIKNQCQFSLFYTFLLSLWSYRNYPIPPTFFLYLNLYYSLNNLKFWTHQI